MLEKYFKSASEKFAAPFINICIKLGLKPNVLSFFGLLIVIIGCYLFLNDTKTIGALLDFSPQR